MSQFTHPYNGATSPIPHGCRCGHVSIHAPVQGATRRRNCDIIDWQRVSIHAPVKGATTLRLADSSLTAFVSIHAPVQGATNRFRFVVSIHAPVQGAILG